MQLPEMTALQFLVVRLLLRGEKSGKNLAEALAALGIQHSQPAFSRLMGRMMAAGYVDAKYRVRTDGSRVVRERHYAVTDVGLAHWELTRDFYLNVPSPPQDFVPVRTIASKYVDANRKTRDEVFRRKIRKVIGRIVDAHMAAAGRRRRR